MGASGAHDPVCQQQWVDAAGETVNAWLTGACVKTENGQNECLLVGRCWFDAGQRPLAVQVVIDCSFSMGTVLRLKKGARISAWELCVKLFGDLCAPPFSPMVKAKKFDLFVVASNVEHKECASAAELLRVLYEIGPPHGLTDIDTALRMAVDVAKVRKTQGFQTYQFCFTDGDATRGNVNVFDQAAELAALVPMAVFAYSPVDNKYWRNILKLGSHPLGGWCINKVNRKGNSSLCCPEMEQAFERFINGAYLMDDGSLLCKGTGAISRLARPVDGLPCVQWPVLAECWRLTRGPVPQSYFEARNAVKAARNLVAPDALAKLPLDASTDVNAATAVAVQRALLQLRLSAQVKAQLWQKYWEKRERAAGKRCAETLQAAEEARLTLDQPCLMRRDSMYADDDHSDRCPIASDCAWVDFTQGVW
jgi:hypothetical protein